MDFTGGVQSCVQAVGRVYNHQNNCKCGVHGVHRAVQTCTVGVHIYPGRTEGVHFRMEAYSGCIRPYGAYTGCTGPYGGVQGCTGCTVQYTLYAHFSDEMD